MHEVDQDVVVMYTLPLLGQKFWHWSGNPPPSFPPKIVYSYVIEVADSESDLSLHSRALVSEIFAFYHLLEYARGRPGRRGHVHLGHNISIQIFFSNFFNIFTFIMFMRVMRVYVGYLLLRVHIYFGSRTNGPNQLDPTKWTQPIGPNQLDPNQSKQLLC